MRIRLIYEKYDTLRYSSTLDLQKIWERSLRRAKINITYTQGFHPHPKMQIALPLPLGFISQVEVIDIWIDDDLNSNQIKKQLYNKLPYGLKIKSILEIESTSNSFVNQIKSVSYKVKINSKNLNFEEFQNRINQFIEKKTIHRTRMKKSYDLRPLVNSLLLVSDKNSSIYLLMNLSAKAGKTGRPDEIVDELGLDIVDCVIIRTSIETYENIGGK